MGFNARYRMWNRENWIGYAPTIHAMQRRSWSLTLTCRSCRLEIAADAERIIRQRGRDWSPWGKTAKCPRVGCAGRMTMSAYAPGPGVRVEV